VTDWISQTITYTYNAASWPVNVSLSNGVTISNTYDNAGQLLERAHASDGFLLSSFQYVYNELGNRTLVTETLFTPYHVLLPLISNAGEEEQMMEGESLSPQLSPQDAYPAPLDAETDSSPDPYPEPVDESEETSFWDGLLSWISELLGWGTTAVSAHPASAPLMTTLAGQPETIPSGLNQTVIEYSYDPLSRLTAADYSDGTYFHYTHDAVGNRLSEVTEVYTTTYSYDDANRLITAGEENYTWDNNGNLLADGVYTYTYSAANRLVAVEDGLSIVSKFAYNGLGDRVSQESGEETIYYKLDLAAGLTQVLADNDYAYLYGNRRISQHSAAATEYFLGDALGSVRQLTGKDGDIRLIRNYKPYGEIVSSAGYGESAFAFTGEANDTSTNLIYLRARFYAPSQGRFTSRDVWEGDYYAPMSYNAWLYTFANPAKFIDPTGKLPLLIFDRDPEPRLKHNMWITANYWNETEKATAERAAYDVGKALANTINASRGLLAAAQGIYHDKCSYLPLYPIPPSRAFLLVYGGAVTFRHITDSDSVYAQTQNRNLVNVYKNYRENYAVQHPGWIVHELGHAFEHAVSPGRPWDSPGRMGLHTDFLKRKPANPNDRDRNAGFAGGFENWQYSRSNERGEIFADMFLGWVYNTWATTSQGRLTEMAQRRADYMSQQMPVLIGIILGIEEMSQ
jgi:RHS repeat-associated protein